jgi:hypothetical protein
MGRDKSGPAVTFLVTVAKFVTLLQDDGGTEYQAEPTSRDCTGGYMFPIVTG